MLKGAPFLTIFLYIHMQASLTDSFLADLEELSDNEGYPVSCFVRFYILSPIFSLNNS